MFIPTTKAELNSLGWQQPDIILVSGDTYIDSPYIGVSIIGQLLIKEGYKVAIIAQPDINSDLDITRLGDPRLFWGVSAGAVDSMVANYTALKKPRKADDMTAGGINNRRPDRAVIAYTNLIKRYYKTNKPIVLGGVEASLRRIAHYDFWDNSVRRSIIFDSKADLIVYGMGEKTIIELADKINAGQDYRDIRGICYIDSMAKSEYIELPSFEQVREDKKSFIEMFDHFYKNNDPINSKGLVQKHGNRYLIQNPPSPHLTAIELDKIYELNYEYDVHPFYKIFGKTKALDTIRFSITSHRGCFGECNFCAITMHQGRRIVSRSKESIIRETKRLAQKSDFKGHIFDVGGATANMYDMSCKIMDRIGPCGEKRCMTPDICKAMKIDHHSQVSLLKDLQQLPGMKKISIGSGLRYDLIISDKKSGEEYFDNLVENHVSGQLKIAPEHVQDDVLSFMGKTSADYLKQFREKFNKKSKEFYKNQFLTYYFIAAHPGCDENDMRDLNNFIKNELKLNPEQVQIFTPTPSTYSTLMYYTGIDPSTGKEIFVERDPLRKERQKKIIVEENKKK
ncbi:MAG: YgiQ family radical SAM protein [Candidatus Kapabacteria bacterium]|nr:YgiQ family radical SAM protein [Candidatus Kapabacteria bacterium]